MTEFFQKIVFFIEPADKACDIPAKIGKLFLNRFGIDEDANSEILKVYHLDHILFDDVESLKLTLDVIDMGVKTMVEFGHDNMLPHFVYCASYHYNEEKLRYTLLEKLAKYEIQFAFLTTLRMRRIHLITKEKAKKASEEKLKNERGWGSYKGSINDDLDSFFNILHNQKRIIEEEVWSFFTPKLTKEELKLVAEKNREHMRTYLEYMMADVNVREMNMSDSKDKYVHGRCNRQTFILTPGKEPKTYQHDGPNKRVGASASEDRYFFDQYSSDQYFLGRRLPRRPRHPGPLSPRPFRPLRSGPITNRFFFPEFNLPIGQPRDERPPTEPEPCPQQPIVRLIFVT